MGFVRPKLFRIADPIDTLGLQVLLTGDREIIIIDHLDNTINELEKISFSFSQSNRSQNQEIHHLETGVWIYYPWKNTLVHMPDKEDFIKLRTSRNKYKITEEEQLELSRKKVGIIGLSVGQSVAIPLVMERSCGMLRIADFDNLELTNTNRIRSSIINLGLPKTTILAREIAEIDPFIEVDIYNTAITQENIDSFILDNGKLDIIVDECDDLLTKLTIRKAAKKYGIPVVMDTSDNLFLDMERYDLDPNYQIFHGIVNLDLFSELDKPEKRTKLLFDLLEFETLSERGKFSISEIGKSINTWPQLATDVTAGGAICAKVIRNILLGDNELQGRLKLDLIQEIKSRRNKT